jgi:hypothetical protein
LRHDFEKAFAKFLALGDDVKAFTKLPTVFGFAIDYTDGAGNLRSYYPDFVAVDDQEKNTTLALAPHHPPAVMPALPSAKAGLPHNPILGPGRSMKGEAASLISLLATRL